MTDQPAAAARSRGALPDVPRATWWNRLWQPFWALPTAILVASIVIGALLPELDRRVSHELPYIFDGGPSGARDLLGNIAGAMISVTGLVFSITIVVLQLASSQFTPRILQGFLSNRTTQVTLGIFSASFVYSLTVLRAVRGDSADVDVFVPQLSITVAFLLVLAAVGVFFTFIHHITSSIQISNIISRIGDQARLLIERMYPLPDGDHALTPGPTWSPDAATARTTLRLRQRHGVITHIDFRRLVQVAEDLDLVVSLDEPIGAFVAADQPIGTIWHDGTLADDAPQRVGRTIVLGAQRTNLQDLAFSVRQLVDIGERALSAGINDPTTAVQVIDELHGILRHLVVRQSISPFIADEEGSVRVVHHPPSFADLLALSTEELLHYGKDTIQLPRALLRMLDDLRSAARPEHQGVIGDVRRSVVETCKTDDSAEARA